MLLNNYLRTYDLYCPVRNAFEHPLPGQVGGGLAPENPDHIRNQQQTVRCIKGRSGTKNY
jgi:hypothetical protein